MSDTVLATAAALKKEHENIQFHFYSNNAVDIGEKLEHGTGGTRVRVSAHSQKSSSRHLG